MLQFGITTIFLTIALSLSGFAQNAKPAGTATTKVPFGTTPDGKPVLLYTLRNSKGMEVCITNYGAIIVSLKVPDASGKFDDVVLGFDSLSSYIKENPYFGAVVGRYGNRIAKGKFKLNDHVYTLATNDGPNALHGGVKGFDKVVWKAQEGNVKGTPALLLTYVSPDGEEGYPGKLAARVIYSVSEENELHIRYMVASDKPTVANLTQHSYFNLAGAGNGTILNEVLMIKAEKFTPVDSTLIPTGEIRKVKDTPFDFTTPTTIGARIENDDEQLHIAGGYDHNFVLESNSDEPSLAAQIYDKTTGRVLEVLTTEPGLQFYSGNFLDGHLVGKGGKPYPKHAGFCLETQHFPDSPNKPNFPSTVLTPGTNYISTTIYRFSTMKVKR